MSDEFKILIPNDEGEGMEGCFAERIDKNRCRLLNIPVMTTSCCFHDIISYKEDPYDKQHPTLLHVLERVTYRVAFDLEEDEDTPEAENNRSYLCGLFAGYGGTCEFMTTGSGCVAMPVDTTLEIIIMLAAMGDVTLKHWTSPDAPAELRVRSTFGKGRLHL